MSKRRKPKTNPSPPVVETTSGPRWVLRATAAVLLLLGLVPMANLVTFGRGLPWYKLVADEWLLWSGALLVVALLLGFALRAPIERMIARASALLLAPAPRVFGLFACALTCALALYFGWHLFGWQATTGDEMAQRFQAELLAHGRLFARSATPSEFFSTLETLDVGGRWFSQFPIGGPAILAIGAVLRAPFVVNPLLAGVAAAAVYRFAAKTGDELTARFATLLFALSPFVLFMAGSQMNHVSTLAFLWLALAQLPDWARAANDGKARRDAAIVGLTIGIAATIRPYDAAIVGLAIGVFQLRAAARSPVLRRSLLVELGAGALPVVLLLAANWATVGAPFTFGYDALNGPQHRPGFHMAPGGIDHTPRRGLYLISAYLMKLDVGLFAWPVPAMLLVVLTLLLLRRATQWDALQAGTLVLLIVGYAAYWFEGYFVGPRFLFTAAPIFVLLTARFAPAVRDRVRVPALRAAAALLIPFWLIAAWASPAAGERFFGVWLQADAYRATSVGDAIAREADKAGLANGLVFIPEGWHAQLAAKLRALGWRPLEAEHTVMTADACTLEHALAAAAAMPDARGAARAQMVADAIQHDGTTRAGDNLTATDQLAFVPGRALDVDCRALLTAARSPGGNLIQLLPYARFDQDGALGGPVIYARDLGADDERLRTRYGTRRWYVARVATSNTGITVTFEPYAPPAPAQ